ncbi:MAG: TusE/DsrC/DsvC family sulfur relay protein [bacterium]
MSAFSYQDKTYKVDNRGFLLDFQTWDEDFAIYTARQLGLPPQLTAEQWGVIRFIRERFSETGRCPVIYECCRMNGLSLAGLSLIFPSGYLRGACKMAGITYREGYLGHAYLPGTADDLNVIASKKTYEVDIRGFLVDPESWDENYAAHRAFDMKIPGLKLTERHWQIIKYLREIFAQTGEVPTVYETCKANEIDLSALETLFPDGYHRCAVKIAGLRVR